MIFANITLKVKTDIATFGATFFWGGGIGQLLNHGRDTFKNNCYILCFLARVQVYYY